MWLFNRTFWINERHLHHDIKLQNGAIKHSQFFPKLSQKTPHSSPVRVSYGVSFVSLMFDLGSANVITLLNAILWQMWPHYNATWLYQVLGFTLLFISFLSVSYNFGLPKYTCLSPQWHAVSISGKLTLFYQGFSVHIVLHSIYISLCVCLLPTPTEVDIQLGWQERLLISNNSWSFSHIPVHFMSYKTVNQ